MKHSLLLLLVFSLVSCGHPGDGVRGADAVLAAARQRLGGDEAVAGFETIRTVANVVGPRSEFTTGIWSAVDGRARMEQSGGFAAGVHPEGDWLIDPQSGRPIPLPEQTLAFIRGHELHTVVLAPETRYNSLTVQDTTTFGGTRAVPILMKSPLGADAVAYFALSDSMPLGFRMLAADPDVFITLDDWDDRGGLMIFTTAVFRQGDEEYLYDYVEVSLISLPDSVFREP